jgi:hypothetical protein
VRRLGPEVGLHGRGLRASGRDPERRRADRPGGAARRRGDRVPGERPGREDLLLRHQRPLELRRGSPGGPRVRPDRPPRGRALGPGPAGQK